MPAALSTRAAISALGARFSFKRKGHVVGDRHMRVERVILEHHGDVALFRRHIVHHALADPDLARRDFLEARDHAQQGGLAAARGADERDEFPVEDLDIDAVNDLGRTVGLADILDADARHAALSPNTIALRKFSVAVLASRA